MCGTAAQHRGPRTYSGNFTGIYDMFPIARSEKYQKLLRRKASGLMGPHSASLGMLFYTGNMFPKAYKNTDRFARNDVEKGR